MEPPLLEISSVYFLLEGEIGPLPEAHQLEVSGAKLLLVLRYHTFELQYARRALELCLLAIELEQL